ncbi:MFS transporter [Pseudomonas sp. AFG_SD02_1510_Pfu_092]|uniref:MFS transporter n=1 Tax=Pseudomonas sp. AFG_SD02_1510_Pfu_092 TaxID=2259497 RepID=UPI000DEF1174|nr:MFS transporter [Pseudomonas sp. AFG_SD02_1510_Pfu_092]RCL20841.1 MFS transporter [Pseudomonas sp. AFG_SD02_1510_Pfu_092]
MTLCVFALIASEFMPVSLLTPIANALSVSEGLAGYGIAISGAFAVLTSLSVSRLAGGMNRKTLLLLLTALMCVSGLVVGLASNYFVYMIGRALIGVVIGGFWSMSAAVAIRLVPTESVPKALAIFNGGNALATVVAAPLGSYLGGVIGWRGAFLCLVPIGLIALAWQWISLPSMQAQKRASGSASVFTLLGNPLVALGMLAVGLFFMGQFELFTYIRPFLETVTHVDVPTLSSMLLALGVAGFLGTLFIGSFLKKGLYPTLIIIPLLMAALGMGLVTFGGSVAVVFVLLSLWGLVATAAPVGWWSWLALSVPEDAEAGGGLMVAVIQLSIALGSTLGGVLFDSHGYQTTFAAAAILLIASSGVSLLTARTRKAVVG